MKSYVLSLCLIFATSDLCAQAAEWQPSPGHTQLPLWPDQAPDAQLVPGPESVHTTKDDDQVGGKPYRYVSNVSQPTLTVYAPQGKNSGAVVVVIPGGGFEILAMDLEGTEVCDWLTSNGVTCVLLKYRVPGAPYDWHCKCRPDNFVIPTMALEDVQRAVRLVRSRAVKLHIDPHKVGVLGFSAGGYLVAEISTQYERRLYQPVDAADQESCRPDFAVAIYPGHMDKQGNLNQNVPVTAQAPPTFLLQAEDDGVDSVDDSLLYYAALKQAGVPVEMHLYAQGGHAFGLRPTKLPITHWPELVTQWLRTIDMIP